MQYTHLPSKSLVFKSSYIVIFNTSPNYSFLKVFWCLCFHYFHPYVKHKFQARSSTCTFLDYALNECGFVYLDMTNKKLFVSRNVVFSKVEFPFTQCTSLSSGPSHTSLSTLHIPQ